jgi:hypothetical protein
MTQVLHHDTNKRERDDEDSEPPISKHPRTEQPHTTSTGQQGSRSSELHVTDDLSHPAPCTDRQIIERAYSPPFTNSLQFDQEEWVLGPSTYTALH